MRVIMICAILVQAKLLSIKILKGASFCDYLKDVIFLANLFDSNGLKECGMLI